MYLHKVFCYHFWKQYDYISIEPVIPRCYQSLHCHDHFSPPPRSPVCYLQQWSFYPDRLGVVLNHLTVAVAELELIQKKKKSWYINSSQTTRAQFYSSGDAGCFHSRFLPISPVQNFENLVIRLQLSVWACYAERKLH